MSAAVKDARADWLYWMTGPGSRPVLCDRCGAVADADRIDVSMLGDPAPAFVWGRITCTTVGCVDERGSAAVDPPDEPGELTREDRRWLRRQRQLAEEFGRASRLLFAEADQF